MKYCISYMPHNRAAGHTTGHTALIVLADRVNGMKVNNRYCNIYCTHYSVTTCTMIA